MFVKGYSAGRVPKKVKLIKTIINTHVVTCLVFILNVNLKGRIKKAISENPKAKTPPVLLGTARSIA